MGEKKMLTAKEFAAETGISYPVVMKWLKAGKIPGEQTSFNVWQIPSTAVARFLKPENRPQKGRPKKPRAKKKAEENGGPAQ
jgi:excisionase family DNA binding protein